MVSFKNPWAVLLSMWSGVGGYGCPISSRAFRIGMASFAVRNAAAISASGVEDITFFIMLHTVWIGYLFLGVFSEERKKCPAALLLALGSER